MQDKEIIDNIKKDFLKLLDFERNTLNENSLPIMHRGYKNAKKQIEKNKI